MPDLRRLRFLHEFRLRGTIAAVAQALSYSPSSVSEQLSLLEREAGVPLFTRVGRKLYLTAKGQQLALRAAQLLEFEDTVREELSSGSGSLTGTVRLSVIQSAAHAIVPEAMESLARSHPLLRVELFQAPPEIALFELSGRRYDIVVAEQYPGVSRPRRADFDMHDLGSDAMWLVAQQATETCLEHLADASWVMEPPGTAAREWAVQQCRAAGFEPDVRFETEDLAVHLKLIERGLAYGILPGLFLSAHPLDNVQLIPLPNMPMRTLFTTARIAEAASAAIEACRAALATSFAQKADRLPSNRRKYYHSPL